MADKAKIQCPGCPPNFMMDEARHRQLIGQTIRCPNCNTEIKIQAVDEAAPAAPAAPVAPPAPPPAQSAKPSGKEPYVPAMSKRPKLSLATPDSRKKCVACGKDIGFDAIICALCGVEQATGQPPSGPKRVVESAGRPKLAFRREAEKPPRTCIRCQQVIGDTTLVCPNCRVDQNTGKYVPRDSSFSFRVLRQTLSRWFGNLYSLALRLLILGLIGLAIYVIYRFVLSQTPS